MDEHQSDSEVLRALFHQERDAPDILESALNTESVPVFRMEKLERQLVRTEAPFMQRSSTWAAMAAVLAATGLSLLLLSVDSGTSSVSQVAFDEHPGLLPIRIQFQENEPLDVEGLAFSERVFLPGTIPLPMADMKAGPLVLAPLPSVVATLETPDRADHLAFPGDSGGMSELQWLNPVDDPVLRLNMAEAGEEQQGSDRIRLEKTTSPWAEDRQLVMLELPGNAGDVSIETDPSRIVRYRLLGYESTWEDGLRVFFEIEPDQAGIGSLHSDQSGVREELQVSLTGGERQGTSGRPSLLHEASSEMQEGAASAAVGLYLADTGDVSAAELRQFHSDLMRDSSLSTYPEGREMLDRMEVAVRLRR